MTGILFFASALVFSVMILVHYARNGKLAKGLLFNSASGLGSLGLLSFFGGAVGLTLPFTFTTGLLCFALGLPGVLLLTILKLIWFL